MSNYRQESYAPHTRDCSFGCWLTVSQRRPCYNFVLANHLMAPYRRAVMSLADSVRQPIASVLIVAA